MGMRKRQILESRDSDAIDNAEAGFEMGYNGYFDIDEGAELAEEEV